MAPSILRVKNWAKFQHYKDRAPPWIKLQRTLLDDRAFHCLPDASRALAPMLWLLASETQDGSIADPVNEISFRLRMTIQKVDAALKPLIDAGFFTLEQCASAPIAERQQDAPQRESRDRGETETEDAHAFSDFVEAARKNGWPTPRALDAGRRKKLRLRLQEHGLDGWRAMLERAGRSDFLRTKFALKFDWILEPANFTKVIEGNYDGTPQAPPQTFVQRAEQTATAVVDRDGEGQWRARLKTYRPGGFWLEGDWGPKPESGHCRAPAAVLDDWRRAAT